MLEEQIRKTNPKFRMECDLLVAIHNIVLSTLHAAENSLEHRTGCFQFLTFHMVLDQSLKPWLVKVGTGPFPEEKTKWISEMNDEMMP